MEKGQENWRMSLKEPPPPYAENSSSGSSEPPSSPRSTRRGSIWSRRSSIAKKDDSWPSSSSIDSSEFNAANLQKKLYTSDMKFAKTVIQLIAPKVEEGHLSYLEGSGWGFTFSIENVDNTEYKRCQLDLMLGFNAFAYRRRFPFVEELARQDLESRGFEVRYFQICVSDVAIGVKWIIDF